MTSSTDNTVAQPQNYILYRTVPWVCQPDSYAGLDGKTVTPKPVTQEEIGYVVSAQTLYGLNGVTAPDGFAYALDADGKYPIGSIYTAPATGSASA